MKRRINLKRTLALLLALILAMPLSALAEAVQPDAVAEETAAESAEERTEATEATEQEAERELQEPDIPEEAATDEAPPPEVEAEAADEPAPEDGAQAALSVRVEPGEGALLRAVIDADGEVDCRWQAARRDEYLAALSAGADAESLWTDIDGAPGDALDAFEAFGEDYAEYSYRCVARAIECEAASEPYSFPVAPAADDTEQAPGEGEPVEEEAPGEVHPLFAAELSFVESEVRIGKGERYRPALSAMGEGTLSFESSKPSVFSVDSGTGEITGIKTGKGKLTVSDGSRSASVSVQVCAAPKKFSLVPSEATLGVGEELVLAPKLPSKTAGHITSCRSSNDGVVAVEGSTIRAVAQGAATITAELFNGKQATCAVTVLRAPEEGCMALGTPEGRDDCVMGVDETLQLTLNYSEGFAGGCEFSSSNDAILSIDAQSGVATAHSVGRATIYATAYNGVQVQREFTVRAKPDSLSLQSVPKTMGVGEEFDLFPALSNRAGEECGGGATYRSSKPSVVQVLLCSGYARLVAKKTGKAKITVTTYNKRKKSVTITVKKAPTEIEIEPYEVVLGMGETGVKFKPVFKPKGSFANVRWSSEKPNVVLVNEKGELTTVAPGMCWIRGEITLRNADGKMETIGSSGYVTVTQAPVEGECELNFPRIAGEEKLTLGVGETMRAQPNFGNGADGGRTFKSSKKSVATVDAKGNVKGKKAGKATITATMYNGVKMSKTIQVVNAPKKIQITNLPPEGYVLRYGEQWDLDVKITDKKKKAVEGVGYTFEDDDRYAVHVDSDTGVVTGNSFVSDTAEITVKTYNGKKARVTLRVGEPEDGLDIYNGENKRTSRLKLTTGQSEQLHVAIPFTPEPQNVKWWSDDKFVARVENGVVTARSEGSTMIYASADDPNEPGRRLTNYCLVTVEKPVYGIALDHASLTLVQGQRATLTPTLTGLDGVSASSIRWESSNARVVNVSNGELEALSRGTATVTASLDDPNAPGSVLKAECVVTVERAPFGISLNQSELKLMAGQRATLTATLTNLPGASQSDVSWRSSDDGVATVQAGSVKAVAEGSATITASIEDPEEPGSILEAQCAVTVEKATYGIYLDQSELTLQEGGSAALTASLTGFPEGEEPEISWSSSREGVATVRGGTVSGVAAGRATITASAANPLNPDEPLTAECAVTVRGAFALSAERLSLEVGDTATLTATLRGEAVPSEDITWTSGRDAVATVRNGLVTAVAGGAATILASYNDNGTTRTARCQVSVNLQAWQEPPKAEEPRVTDDGRVEFTWEPSGGEGASQSYAVYEIVDGVEVLRGTVTGNRMELSGVTAGEHTYIVRPRERRGLQWVVGESSGTVTVTVEDWAASPRLNSAEETEMGSVALSWSAVSGAQSYAIYELASDDTLTKLQEVSGTSVTLSGVPGGRHRYAVRAIVDGKQGNLSNVLGAGVTSIKLDIGDLEVVPVEVGKSVQLTASLNLPAGADQELSWRSSDIRVASVNGAGLVTGVVAGIETITATSSNGSAARCQVMVYEAQKDSDFVIEDGVLTEYKGLHAYVVVPEGVTRIVCTSPTTTGSRYRGVFKNTDYLLGVVLPDSVTEIGEDAFLDCNHLSSITIPKGLTIFGKRAFSHCSSISISIPNGVTSIEQRAFEGCHGLKSITIPGSVKRIEGLAFQGCDNLESLTISDGVESIGGSAFGGCEELTSITIPGSVKSLNGFGHCIHLSSVTILDGVQGIEDLAFYKCTRLKNITIPSSVTRIGKEAFSDCTALESVTISNSATELGANLFSGCSNLRSFTIPNGMTSIGNSVFADSGLTSISIPNSVTSIGMHAFDGCSNLTSISIPNSVTFIGMYAFDGCSNLTSIAIPDSVTCIDSLAFYGCTSLTSITIPKDVTWIGTDTFSGCSNLESVKIPSSVTSIGSGAFEGCINLRSIVLQDSVEEIGTAAFPQTTTIICNPGSAAEAYAKENGNPIQYINGQKEPELRIVDGVLTAGTGMVIDLNALLNAPGAVLHFQADDPRIVGNDSSNVSNPKVLRPGETKITVDEFAAVGQTSTIHTSFTLKAVGFEQPQLSVQVGFTTSQAPTGISGTWSSSNEGVATVDQSGTVTGVSDGVASIIVTRSDGFWASYTTSVGAAATSLAADPEFMFLAVGESGALSASVPSGYSCSGFSYESASDGARVDAQGNVTGVRPGRTKVYVISRDDPNVRAACEVVVLAEDEEIDPRLEEIERAYEALIQAHEIFTKSHTGKDGTVYEPLDLSGFTDGWMAQLWDRLDGNVQGLDTDCTRQYLLAEQILSELSSSVRKSPISVDAFRDLIKACGFGDSALGLMQKCFDFDDAGQMIDMTEGNTKQLAQVLDELKQSSKLDDLELSAVITGSLQLAYAVTEGLSRYALYSQIDPKELQAVIDGLESGWPYEYQQVIAILKMVRTNSGLMKYIACSEGMTKGEDELIAILGAGADLIPVVGIFTMVASGTIWIFDSLTNLDGMQEKAFSLKYAVNMATDYQPHFQQAYKDFMRNYGSEEYLEEFINSAKTFARLVAMEYNTFCEYLGEADEALIKKFKNWFRDYGKEITSYEAYSSDCRDEMLYAVGKYKWVCEGNHSYDYEP